MLQNRKSLLSLLGLTFLFLGLVLLTQQAQKPQDIRKEAATLSTPLIAFSTSTQDKITRPVINNSTINVPIYVRPGGFEVIGVDVVILFNKSKLQLTNIIPVTNTSFKTFLPLNSSGTFYKTSVINKANRSGIIRFSAIAYDKGKTITGHKTTFTLATLRFKAVKNGNTNVSFVARKSNGVAATDDTNLAAVGKDNDVLNQVQQLIITVNPPPTATPTPTPRTVAAPNVSPSSKNFAKSVKVTASANTNGSTLRYTLNGTNPAASSTVFPSNGITITSTKTVKVRAFKSGWKASNIAKRIYTKLAPTPTPTPIPYTCPAGVPAFTKGNANCDGQINTIDFNLWFNKFRGSSIAPYEADFSRDGRVNTEDFNVWLNSFRK